MGLGPTRRDVGFPGPDQGFGLRASGFGPRVELPLVGPGQVFGVASH